MLNLVTDSFFVPCLNGNTRQAFGVHTCSTHTVIHSVYSASKLLKEVGIRKVPLQTDVTFLVALGMHS